jgi:hypothetical protein
VQRKLDDDTIHIASPAFLDDLKPNCSVAILLIQSDSGTLNAKFLTGFDLPAHIDAGLLYIYGIEDDEVGRTTLPVLVMRDKLTDVLVNLIGYRLTFETLSHSSSLQA